MCTPMMEITLVHNLNEFSYKKMKFLDKKH